MFAFVVAIALATVHAFFLLDGFQGGLPFLCLVVVVDVDVDAVILASSTSTSTCNGVAVDVISCGTGQLKHRNQIHVIHEILDNPGRGGSDKIVVRVVVVVRVIINIANGSSVPYGVATTSTLENRRQNQQRNSQKDRNQDSAVGRSVAFELVIKGHLVLYCIL